MPVTDAPLEADSLKSLANQASALQLLTAIAKSVTTPGGGLFMSDAGYLNSLNQLMAGGVSTAQAFAASFPGWMPLPPNAAQLSKQITALTLQTYSSALSVAAQQAGGMASEDSHLASISAQSASATGLLAAIQANTDATLALAQQVQLQRQLSLTQLTVDTVRAGEELNERAQQQATVAQSTNLGVSP